MMPINWTEKVAKDYRKRIITDPDHPILAVKASRDRYTSLPNQKKYQGLPYLGSKQSEDALTWNVFRTLQETKNLGIIASVLAIGEPRGLLFWTIAPEIDEIHAELQYVTGSLIRKYDGVFPGQTTEPDVILLGTTGIAVIECKLSEPDKAPSHLWEGTPESVDKRLPTYLNEIPNLLGARLISNEIAPFYQLVRMAFYAMKLGKSYQVEPVLASIANNRNWTKEIRKLRKSPAQLWDTFRNEMLGADSPRCANLSWQSVGNLIQGSSLAVLSDYLSTHPCLKL